LSRLLHNNIFAGVFISILAAVVLIPLIGNCHLFDWDEINFAECAREMLVTGNYSLVQINYQPFWEKPPLFIWLQALSMNLFGVNEFAARLPNAVCGIVTVLTLFFTGKKLFNLRFGLTWSLIHLSSLLPHLYFKSGIIDPWFNFFILLSIILFFFAVQPKSKNTTIHFVLSAFTLGLAVLTKGPAALIIVSFTLLVYMLLAHKMLLLKKPVFYLFKILVLVSSFSWFAYMYMSGKKDLLDGFMDYQIRLFKTPDSGHDGPFFYHMAVLLLGCFPASILFLLSLRYKINLQPSQREFKLLMLVLFVVVLVIFSIVKTKIVHYSSLCYVPLSFMASLLLYKFREKFKRPIPAKAVYVFIASVVFIIITAFTQFPLLKDWILQSGLILDEFTRLNLQAYISYKIWELTIPLLYLVSVIVIYRGLFNHKIATVVKGFVLHLLFIILAINVFVPKIELISQRSAIQFYKYTATQNAYIETHAFKSYAYLFYSLRMPIHYHNSERENYVARFYSYHDSTMFKPHYYAHANSMWMLEGVIDKPAFIVVKSTAEDMLKPYPGVKKLYSQNGFSFYMRLREPDN